MFSSTNQFISSKLFICCCSNTIVDRKVLIFSVSLLKKTFWWNLQKRSPSAKTDVQDSLRLWILHTAESVKDDHTSMAKNDNCTDISVGFICFRWQHLVFYITEKRNKNIKHWQYTGHLNEIFLGLLFFCKNISHHLF